MPPKSRVSPHNNATSAFIVLSTWRSFPFVASNMFRRGMRCMSSLRKTHKPRAYTSSDRPPKSKESGAAAITTAGCHDHAGEPFDGRSRTGASYLVRLAERTPGLPEHGADRVRADSSTVSFTRSSSPCADSPNTSSSAPTLRGARPVPSTSVRAGSGGGSSSHRRSLRGLPIERWPHQVELSHPEVPE